MTTKQAPATSRGLWAVRWAVRCEDYTTKPFSTQEAAERNRQAIEDAGHCHGTH